MTTQTKSELFVAHGNMLFPSRKNKEIVPKIEILPLEPSEAVSQLDNMPCPTPKAPPVGEIELGRHEEQAPHTLTHAGGFFDLTGSKVWLYDVKNYRLKKHEDFLNTLPKYLEHKHKVHVCVHNQAFAEEIMAAYSPEKADLFLQWAKAFAIIRKTHRERVENVAILTADEDFCTALQVMRYHHLRPKKIAVNMPQMIWEIIEIHFGKEPFKAIDICTHILLDKQNVAYHLDKMIAKKKLRLYSTTYNRTLYQKL